MDTTSYMALGRQLALERAMTVHSGNIANSTTNGFKAELLAFEAVPVRAGEPGRLHFVQDVGSRRNLEAGPLEATGNPLDIAIDGEGYFAVQVDGEERYTRNGHFGLNELGEIVTSAGHPLLGAGGAPLNVPPEAQEISVAGDGTVSTEAGVAGRIELVGFAAPQALERVGNSLYRSDAPAEPLLEGRLVQGMVEGSNVQPVLEMTRMMETVRAFQSTQKFLETHHDLVRRSVEGMLRTAA